MKNYRHGEVILIPCKEIKGKKIKNCILAEGEITGHKHEIKKGADLYDDDGQYYLKVKEEIAKLIHPDHNTIGLPKGNYKILVQREYVVGDEKYRRVTD